METLRDVTRVLVVDDEESQRTALASMIKLWGYWVETAADGQEALEKLATFGAHVIVTDLNMPRMTGQELLKRLKEDGDAPPIIVQTAYGSLETSVSMVHDLGAFWFLEKPVQSQALRLLLERAAAQEKLAEHAERLERQLSNQGVLGEMVGSSPKMREVFGLIQQVAPSRAAVLITGESGTGKELAARAIHALSPRRNGPFVALNCAAMPDSLMESELFGHEKGAFTGTVGAREGYFEQAGDGTLFLDEIGDLSLFTQVKLLRVLQQMEFSRLGSNKLIPLRARLIFATHRDLSQLVAEGKFRQDLFYRINVMRIESPSLQEHPEDIPQIADHFLRHYSQIFQKPMDTIDPEAMQMLQNYPWPGNVRELENVMQRAIILSPGMTLRAEDLTLSLPEEDEDEEGDVVNIGDYHPAGSFERQLRDYKIKLAVTAVRENNGNKTLAARSLSISRAYLHRLIRLAEPDPMFDQDLRETVNA
jgi:DNA-binding NtrC family response regulator